MASKLFHLRWNNHLQNLQSLFENLYNEQSLIDVTISCSDGMLYGHKLVLSACSPYFEHIFKDNPCKHPVVILKGIKLQYMQLLLEYMYVGSVEVEEEDLELLLDTATELQIKGLVRTTQDTPNSLFPFPPKKAKTHHSSIKDSQNPVTPSSPIPQLNKPSDDLRWGEGRSKSSASSENDSLRETNIARNNSPQDDEMMERQKEENRTALERLYANPELSAGTVTKEKFQVPDDDEATDYNTLEAMEESSDNVKIGYSKLHENKPIEGDDMNFFCHLCARAFMNKGSYHRHMLTHAGVKPHQCSFCDQSFLRLSHLQRHVRVHTGERPYSCVQCPKQFARSDKLRQHYIIQHNDARRALGPKPRGRPRKNHQFYAPETLSAPHTSMKPASTMSPINSMYPVSISSVPMNAV